ncbi:MAG: hypothetical protein SOV82_14825 [[Ruminococcus] gnavus]|nr:hypothetical protein [Mediterraneibacter gnavus]MDY4170001.1 hypothetical protein [Mediterraneibacter gnavus]
MVKNSPLFGGLFLLEEISPKREKETKKEEQNGKIIIYIGICYRGTSG